jgi:DNA polymerase theta
VLEGHSVLLFCSSRKGCESTARHIAKYLKVASGRSKEVGSEFRDAASAVEALKRCPAGLDPVLEETIPFGVAYHHAGLTVLIFTLTFYFRHIAPCWSHGTYFYIIFIPII